MDGINLINYLIISESVIFSLCFWSMYFMLKIENKKSQLLSFKSMIVITIITSVNILGGLYLGMVWSKMEDWLWYIMVF